jgi:hypothetical protein
LSFYDDDDGEKQATTYEEKQRELDKAGILNPLLSVLVGTAVRDGSLYSAYSRNQTAALIPVPVVS